MPEPKPITELAKGPAKILIFGPPGCGKTTLSTTYGEGAEVLDIGRGLMSALSFKDSFTEQRRKVVFTECYDDNPALPQAWMKLKRRVFEIGEQCEKKTYKQKCVILDELTAMGQNSVRYILYNGNRLPGPNFIPTTKTGITQPEWGLAMQEISNMMIVLRSLPVHVILIAHDVTEEDLDASKKAINVIGKKLAPIIPGYFDEVLHLKIDSNTGKRTLQTQPTYAVIARTRGQLPNNYDVNNGMRQLMTDAGYDPNLNSTVG